MATIVLAAIPLGCRDGANVHRAAGSRRIVCSFLPMSMLTRGVVGELPGVTIETLIPPATGCPHDYELSTADAKRLAGADVVVLSGVMEGFAGEAVGRINAEAKLVIATGALGNIAEHPSHGTERDHDHTGSKGKNLHTWLSLRLARAMAQKIAVGLMAALPEHRDAIRIQAAAFDGELAAIEGEYTEVRRKLSDQKIVTTHDAFEYLADELGVQVIATIQATPRSEPGGRHLADVVKSIRENRVRVVFYESGTDSRLAERVAQEAGVRAAALDALTTGSDDGLADEYVRRMRGNLRVLCEALR